MNFTSLENCPKGLKIASYKKDIKVSWEGNLKDLETEYLKIASSWHEKRRSEFLLGRHLIHTTLKNENVECNQPILIGEKREPLFPSPVRGSITHNSNFVVFAFHLDKGIVGIDIEAKGRVKPEMENQILTSEDKTLLNHFEGELNRSDLLTLVFSAKESCYKGLFPIYKEYFGFKDAFINDLNLEKGTLNITVTKKFKEREGDRSTPILLEGFFEMDGSNIFTFLNPLNLSR